MKSMRKCMALLLVVIMTLAMATTAFADSGNSITINNAQNGETYTAYKMFNLSVSDDLKAFSYTIANEWNSFFTTGAGADYITTETAGEVYVTDVTDAAALAQAAAAAVSGKTAAGYATAANGTAVITGLDNGYYLIVSTNGTIAMIDTTPTDPSPEINEKNVNPTIDKSVKEDSTDTFDDENDAQIGDTVEFKTEIQAQKGAKNYVLHDTMDTGLTLKPDSIAVTGLTKNTDYTVVTSNLNDGCTFEVRFTQTYLDSITSATTLTVTYSAVLNENATLAGVTNKAKLTWGNQSATTEDITTTTTHSFDVLKYDADDTTKAPLAGAIFELHKGGSAVVKLIKISDTEYRVANGAESGAVDTFTTVGTDAITIFGVDSDDDYTLVEKKAPFGFNLLKDPVSISVEADNSLVEEVPNNAGVELPATGGTGTTMLIVFGSILFMATAIVLVTKKRMYNQG